MRRMTAHRVGLLEVAAPCTNATFLKSPATYITPSATPLLPPVSRNRCQANVHRVDAALHVGAIDSGHPVGHGAVRSDQVLLFGAGSVSLKPPDSRGALGFQLGVRFVKGCDGTG